MAGPVAHGSKEVPNGAPDCLAGLAFVFTGELSSFSRDEASDVAKRFGGCVQCLSHTILLTCVFKAVLCSNRPARRIMSFLERMPDQARLQR
jgi:hypothetical protein